MFAVLLRAVGVLALLIAVGVLVWAPWKESEVATLIGADGESIFDDGSFRPVQEDANVPAHELVRYQMPEPNERPPLGEGVTALVWEDLWRDGEIAFGEAEEERVGRPTNEQFPEGTSPEDVMLFFLDIADMRSLQPQIGGLAEDLDGKRVRLAGYTTPVGFAENETRFLLVPELGACIHVPPPPPNQIVYVPEAAGEPGMFEPVWVTGTLKADPVATVLADVAYQLVDAVAEPYQ